MSLPGSSENPLAYPLNDDPLKDDIVQPFQIDTSQYMNYNFHDLGHEYHAHHGPQPDGEALDSTWLTELDKFLRGEDNKLKEHKNFINYKYEYLDKSFPSVEAAHHLFTTPLKEEARKF